MLRRCFCPLFVAAVTAVATLPTAASAEELLLTDHRAFPGQLWLSAEGRPERAIHRREAKANPAYPRAAMKAAQSAIGPDGNVYFASGLDGYLMHLKDGRHEIALFEFGGQIRDVACTGEEHVVYFSVVPTPQDGAPLADGKIYRRDLWNGEPTEIATVRQADVGGNWWGTFAIKNGVIHLATLDTPTRLFKLTSSGPEAVFTANESKFVGLTVAADGTFYVADGSEKIYRTADFQTFEPVLTGERKFNDVSLRPAAHAAGP